MRFLLLLLTSFLFPLQSLNAAPITYPKVEIKLSACQGISVEKGVMRRDPSDVIKVGDLYYVWYTKGTESGGYNGTVWYATSPDGHAWTEKGEALVRGKKGNWDGQSVFTPNIMVAKGRYWLFFTGVSFYPGKGKGPDSKIGIAVSDSPDGPWKKLASNPALSNSDDPKQFDSHLVDDACLIVREGKYWFYYKGRQLGKSPAQTQMGLAIADKPEGPYAKVKGNPVIPGNHEVLVWPQGKGVAAMIGSTGPKQIKRSLLYSKDGMNFVKTHDVVNSPFAPGGYRPEAFTESGNGTRLEWGVHIGKKKGQLPFIQRYDLKLEAKPQEAFAGDVAFLKKHTELLVLRSGDAAVAVAPAYQGRVMTSTFDHKAGPSFGWINRPVIEKGFLSDKDRKGTLEEHIYIFGGEERFWLGPEGGQFALFFKPGTEFEFSDWITPAAIDTEAFKVTSKSESSARFTRDCELINYSGAKFSVGIERTVKMLDKKTAETLLGGALGEGSKLVGYETDNRITNKGKEAWSAETGLLSIWILGMYNPSPETTVVIPFQAGPEEKLGPTVNDRYFGKVPANYLQVENDILFFRGDGTRRGKIGLTPQRSKGIAGSYDTAGKVLNIVTYNVQASPDGFVNSMWEIQKKPYGGDVINSYNDGSPEPGAAPLGPFYELETSSPAAALKPGGTMKHVQRTFHVHGPEAELDILSKRLLGVGLKEIKTAF